MSKILVTYFSATGTTKYYAEKIANYLDADLFEIEPCEKYTTQDLDWTRSSSRSSIECNDRNCRPEIKNRVSNIFDYDTVFIGFPIWWYREPNIIDTFLESEFLDGKTIIPFATSGSSQLGKTEDYLKEMLPSSQFKQGRLVNVMNNQTLQSWLDDLNLHQ